MNATAIGCGCCINRWCCWNFDYMGACSDWEGDGALVVMDEVPLLSFRIFETMKGYMAYQGVLLIFDEVGL